MGTQQTDAYCPTCGTELQPDEYDDENGHEECGTEELWLSPDAFCRLAKRWGAELDH